MIKGAILTLALGSIALVLGYCPLAGPRIAVDESHLKQSEISSIKAKSVSLEPEAKAATRTRVDSEEASIAVSNLCVQVVDATSGEPITKFRIAWRVTDTVDIRQSDTWSANSLTQRESHDGCFNITSLRPGRYDIFVDGTGSHRQTSLLQGIEVPCPQITARLARGKYLEGTITDASGQSVADCRLRLRCGLETVRDCTTDERGQYLLTDLLADEYKLVVCDHDIAIPLRLDSDSGQRQDIRLPNTRRADIELIDLHGNPVPDRIVQMHGPRGTRHRGKSDSNGRCSIMGLQATRYQVLVESRGRSNPRQVLDLRSEDKRPMKLTVY